MRYRSSVKLFIQEILRSLDQGPGPSLKDIEGFTEEVIGAAAGRAREAMPPEDWEEIVEYITNHYKAYGPRSPYCYDIRAKFLCWLAAVGVELLAEL